MGSSDEAKSTREVLTTAQVAERLGISVASVRRLVDGSVLEGFWTAPNAGFQDSRGFALRGHRRVYADSVERYEREARTGQPDS